MEGTTAQILAFYEAIHKGEKTKGAIKDTAGKMTGDKQLQAEGKKDKTKGDLHNIAGDVKDAV